jgi:hypothetical protein
MCDEACGEGTSCVAGECACPEDALDCDGVCIDGSSSNEHCGECDNPCTGGRTCQMGMCECPTDETLCDGTCTDTETDNDNCGGCGDACTGEPTCVEGDCTGCPTGETACGNECVDTGSDADHCGACNDPCPTGESCESGSCTPDVVAEPCTPNLVVADAETTTTPNFGTTGPYCVKVNYTCIGGWLCSNLGGRTLQVNDQARTCGQLPLAAKVNGAYYFEFSSGTFNYTSITVWKGGCTP